MAILEIKKYPDPILRKKAQPVEKITDEIEKLKKDMVETMIKNEGVGLAATQVGQLKRIIIIQTEKDPLELINPKIIKRSKKTEITEEGCLSFPGLRLKIKRAKEVEISARDKVGLEVQISAQGLQARVFQHEIDHLDGRLFIDRLSFFQRLRIRKELKELMKRF
ncbi:MAG TPA: peptide deformylase [Candidatus Nealsonbacteria bacterium]|uniref:Peptide deformylase n=1 Tax=marine sediment metagenome TaxID=412755 RepID=A0A0F9U307_9ZZZZ|nr:peptide deformylase [Candidatus Nealsonbacteria bacterium]HEB46596.1 peptide deformylase [Candidatus Nealsonbacteria bacterium]